MTFVLFACISGGGGDGSEDNENSSTNQGTIDNSIDPNVDNGDFVSIAYPSNLGYNFVDEEGKIQSFQQYFTEFGKVFDQITNERFNLPKGDIFITFQDCGTSNAFYYPDSVEIVMCYDLLIEFVEIYGADNTKSSKAFLFAFFHELGHAFADQFEWVVLGNQESAVDAFAATIMVNMDIAEAAVYAGIFFINSASSWADEHEMGENRLGNLACWATGGAPHLLFDDAIRDLAQQLYEAGRNCRMEYENQRDFTNSLLEPFEKN